MAGRGRARIAVPMLAALLLTGCAGSVAEQAKVPAPPPPAAITLQPGDGAHDVSPVSPISVSVTGGTLNTVALTNADGRQVSGQLAPDHRTWTPTEPLGYGKTYTWSGTATNAAGQRTPVTGSFTTVTPESQTDATLNIGDDQTVGVAAPIILQFDGPIPDKSTVEKALSVQTSLPTEGSWAWLPDSADGARIHWRPKNYWAPGTAVTVTAHLYGLPYGGGAYGAQDLSAHFTIGRSQIVKADVNSHRITVIRDGQLATTYPASYGLDSNPDRTTRSGTHVVMEKDPTERMISQQYHYDVIENWAVRISNNGEFIHANPASAGAQGNSNITHGCINLSDPDAQSYFDSALYGDPVEITNSGVPLSATDGDIYDWTIPWDQWQTMSALH
jgi:lipoprotein-anchoring transpeptidase ErfK/SrfK